MKGHIYKRAQGSWTIVYHLPALIAEDSGGCGTRCVCQGGLLQGSETVIDNKVYATDESLSGMMVTLKAKKDFQEVVLSKPSTSSTYQAGGRAGASVLEFQIEEPGTYIFTANYPGSVSDPEVVLAIGQFKILGTILGGLAIFFGSLAIGGLIIVRTYLKRRKAKEQMVAA